MVQNPPAAGHAAGGDDHAGVACGVEFDGLFHGADEMGLFVHELAFGVTEFVLLVVFAENLRGFDGHGAVQVHGQFGNALLAHDLVDQVQQ